MNTEAVNNDARGRLAFLCMTILGAIACSNAYAKDPAGDAFNMLALIDSSQGDLVAAGQYSEAIRKITAGKPRTNDFAAHNNLCVAYTKTMKFDLAAEACNAAVVARSRKNTVYAWFSTPYDRHFDTAVALTNRGVLRAVTGNHEDAEEDFEAATRAHRDLVESQRNLDSLQSYKKLPVAAARRAH